MEKRVRLIEILEIRTLEGKPVFSLSVSDKEVVLRDSKEKNSNQGNYNKGEKNQTSGQQNNDSSMTDPQKRYLFRILADQGIEGDKAHEHLKKLFHVETLKDVTKFEASKMIEQLLCGTPKAGKTTCADRLTYFLNRNGYQVLKIVERASLCPLRNKHHVSFNIWTACTALIQILEAKEKDYNVVILEPLAKVFEKPT